MQNPRTRWISKYESISTSSKFHKKLQQIFLEDPYWKKFSCYQEVPVSSIVNSYGNNKHCIDWYIDELACVIELHGQQHYDMVNFGNIAYDKAVKNFNNIKYRDNMKKSALEEAGYIYIEIPYKMVDKINGQKLKELIYENTE